MTKNEAIHFLKQLEELILEQHYAKAKNEVIKSFDMAVEALKQPEIIMCNDCKWKQGSECVRFAEVRPFPDDFCSRAERREE